MRVRTVIGWLALCVAAPVWSQSAPAPAATSTAPSPANAVKLETVSVTGVQPGPGLWKVSKDNHVMWVLGTLTPLPRRMEWQSKQVEQVIAQSQELLQSPTANLKVDAGFFSKLALLPSVYGARKNPGGETLQQILPAPMYARWQVLKQQYIGDDSGIEYWRPILAALKLYQKALDRANLTNKTDIDDTLVKLAKRHDLRITPVKYELVIEHPREVVDTIKQTNLHDVSCFNQTMTTVEHDMGALTERANAWSTGDIEALQNYALNSRYQSCVFAVVNADFAQQLGLHDLPQRIKDAWLATAEAAMSRNAQTFAEVPMEQMLAPDGFLAALKARGYTVQSPEELDE